ncbi:MAG: hypothetical protein OEV68_13870, partial [candidate division Zixibacteria bacterium]|nr:hypothetical protein [candidate division Zixibacteria bacterium]
MADSRHISQALYLLMAVSLLFLAARFLGGALFENNWSFTHFWHLPLWYPILWLALSAGLLYLFIGRIESIGKLCTSSRQVVIAATILFVLLVIFRHDSFVLGGGNLKVAMLAQAEVFNPRWFEYGTSMLVSWLHTLLTLFEMPRTMPAVLSWTVVSFMSTLAALVACIQLSRALAPDSQRRGLLFTVMFFGPQGVVYFGFIGVEPVVPAICSWLALLVVRTNREGGVKNLALLWLIAAVGVFMYSWLVFLIPSALFVTVRRLGRQTKKLSLGTLIVGLVGYVIVLAFVYRQGVIDFEFSRFLLFPGGKSPFGNYGLFSLRHISDVVQLFFLAAPTVVVTKLLWMRRLSAVRNDANLVAFSLMALGGGTVLFVMDPFNSIVFDMPRMAAFLTPVALLAGLLLARVPTDSAAGRRLLGAMAALSLIVPLCYLPVMLEIDRVESHAVEQFDKQEVHYLHAGFAFRDAYFYRRHFDERKTIIRIPGFEHIVPDNLLQGYDSSAVSVDSSGGQRHRLGLDTTNLEKANQWDWLMPTKSEDFLNLRGAGDLITAGKPEVALRYLYAMKAKRPYWTDARARLINVLMRLGRYAQTRPELDSVLM